MALNESQRFNLEVCSSNKSNESSIVHLIHKTDPDYMNYQYTYATLLLILAFFGILFNSSLAFYILRKKIHEVSALGSLIFQLSLASLLVAVFCLMADGIWHITVQWYGGDLLCRLIKFLQMFSLYATTLILTGMCIEACVTVTFPLTKSHRAKTILRVKITSLFSWILAAFCSIPQVFYQCVTHGFYLNPTHELVYTVATLLMMCIFPFFVIVICYLIIFVKMSKEAKIASLGSSSLPSRSYGSTHKPTQGKMVYARTRQIFLWMTFMTALTFVVCWVPYYFAMFGHLFQWTISHEALTAIFCFGLSSAVLNPLIFGGFLMCKKNPEKEECFQLQQQKREYSLENTSFASEPPASTSVASLHEIKQERSRQPSRQKLFQDPIEMGNYYCIRNNHLHSLNSSSIEEEKSDWPTCL